MYPYATRKATIGRKWNGSVRKTSKGHLRTLSSHSRLNNTPKRNLNTGTSSYSQLCLFCDFFPLLSGRKDMSNFIMFNGSDSCPCLLKEPCRLSNSDAKPEHLQWHIDRYRCKALLKIGESYTIWEATTILSSFKSNGTCQKWPPNEGVRDWALIRGKLCSWYRF